LLPRCDGKKAGKCGCVSVYMNGCVRAGLAWTTLPVSAHDAAATIVLGDASVEYLGKLRRTKLRELASKHGEDLERLVSVYSSSVHLRP